MQNREPGSGRGGRASGGGATAGGRGRAGGALVQTTATARELAVGDRMCRMTTGCVGSRVNGSMPVNGQIRSTDKSGQRKGADGVETRRKQVQRTGIRRGRPGKGNPARWWRGTAGIEPTGRWGGLVKSRCVSGAGGCVRYVRCLCLSLTDSYMPALVPCRTSCTLPARGLRPQGLDGRLGAAGGRKSGRVCYLLARRSLKAAPRVVGVTSRDVRT